MSYIWSICILIAFQHCKFAVSDSCDNIKDLQPKLKYGWQCVNFQCEKILLSSVLSDCNVTSLNVCRIKCDPFGSLWPSPTVKTTIGEQLIPVNSGKISFNIDIQERSTVVWNLLNELEQYALGVVSKSFKNVNQSSMGAELKILFRVQTSSIKLGYETDESYKLVILKDDSVLNAALEANTYFGIRHGVETLLQLIVYDEFSKTVLMPSEAEILDTPVYKHRGILLDTARNFYSVKSILRTLDAMAMNKLNTFHWHITDSQSFPFQSRHYPEMASYGAYSHEKVYTWSDVEEIAHYAFVRGIRVLPEFDAPSHVGEGWQLFDGEAGGDHVLCFNEVPWSRYCAEPPCGILNPINENVYVVLQKLYEEFNVLFDSDVFHMGGDEVKFDCWKATPTIQQWMLQRNMTDTEHGYLELWSYFQAKVLEKFDQTVDSTVKPKIVLWTSSLTESADVDKFLDKSRYIIQVWTKGNDKEIAKLLNKGYNLIISNYDALYLDCGFGAWIGEGNNNWCSPYINWQKLFDNNPAKILENFTNNNVKLPKNAISQILGMEAALWSEQSDENTVDQRLWPRSAAMAERLWSNPNTTWKSVESRLLYQRERMVARGIQADSIEPLWCLQNEGRCHD